MKATQLIEANPSIPIHRQLIPVDTPETLEVSEFFCDTIQGEGVTTGRPSAFLRLKGCTLDCDYCDTKLIYQKGEVYSFEELFRAMQEVDLINKFAKGQHLVITGGSPLKQQEELIDFLIAFIQKYGFKPIIEIENECTIAPEIPLINLVDVWNNSPKLANSRNPYNERYKPYIIKQLSKLDNSWFKFVIENSVDWIEIEHDYITPGLIRRNQIILMPRGENQDMLLVHGKLTIQMAIRENVRYCTREHIVLWNNQTGV